MALFMCIPTDKASLIHFIEEANQQPQLETSLATGNLLWILVIDVMAVNGDDDDDDDNDDGDDDDNEEEKDDHNDDNDNLQYRLDIRYMYM